MAGTNSQTRYFHNYASSLLNRSELGGQLQGIKMNITDSDGKWMITYGCITNRQTGESRSVSGIPSANALAYMSYAKFIRGCEVGFETGVWPK